MIQQERSLSAWALSQWTVQGTQWKTVPCFCWPVQQQTLQRKAKGTIGQVRMWRVWMPFMCVVSPTICIFYLPFKCLTRGLCVVRFRNNAHCIQSGFSLLQKEAKTRQWKVVKNILKVNWIENKNISASLCQGEELGINLITISQEARESGGGGAGGRRGGSRFWPRCQQMHDFNRN